MPVVVLAAAGLTVAGFVVVQLWLVVLPVLLALLVTGPANFLRRRGIPSAAAALLVMLAAVSLLVGVLVSIVSTIIAEFDDLERSAREGLTKRCGGSGKVRWTSSASRSRRTVDRALEGAAGAGNITGSVLSRAALVVEVVAGLLLMLVVPLLLCP